MNARKVMHKHRNDFALMDWVLPPRLQEKAPEEPNVYNDGSLNKSLCQWWSVGGVGVWWPGRNLADTPLNENERNLVVKTSCKGIMLSTALPGHRASSTRAELGAGIAAMLANAPTHQGTDIMSYMINAHQIIKGLLPRKPFNLLTDGD